MLNLEIDGRSVNHPETIDINLNNYFSAVAENVIGYDVRTVSVSQSNRKCQNSFIIWK